MRVYTSLEEAASEIQRDVSKGPSLVSTRVQQRTGLELPGRETIGYAYSILSGGIPETPERVVEIGQKMGMKMYLDHPQEIIEWMVEECEDRLSPESALADPYPELLHPALKTTIEGSSPSYTYRERLVGAKFTMLETLIQNPDTRRAYWPIFQVGDALRASAPTRIPCSLGYEAMIRTVGEEKHLILFYIQRSADFEHFWLSDVWLASQFQRMLVDSLNHYSEYRGDGLQVVQGQLVHYIISLHSFEVEGTEVY